jgi:acylphosphatase
MKRVHLRARGRVQGVNFRFAAADVARRYGLTGRIRNTEDGDVEAIAEGDDDAVSRFVSWCRRGPASAHVEELAVRELDGGRRYRDFDVTFGAIEER